MKRMMKKFLAIALVLSMFLIGTTTGFAKNPNELTEMETSDIVKRSNGEYTEIVDLNKVVVPYARAKEKTVNANKGLGLALGVGESGTSVPVSFRFDLLPANAKVKSIEIIPGTAVINNNNKNMMGAIAIDSITITNPDSVSATLQWKARGIKDSIIFLDENASGTWTAFIT